MDQIGNSTISIQLQFGKSEKTKSVTWFTCNAVHVSAEVCMSVGNFIS